MIGHVQQAVRRKISDFIHLEDGRIGNRNALTVAAIVTSSALAGVLLAPKPAFAVCACTDYVTCVDPFPYCCWVGRCVNSYDWACAAWGQFDPNTLKCN